MIEELAFPRTWAALGQFVFRERLRVERLFFGFQLRTTGAGKDFLIVSSAQKQGGSRQARLDSHFQGVASQCRGAAKQIERTQRKLISPGRKFSELSAQRVNVVLRGLSKLVFELASFLSAQRLRVTSEKIATSSLTCPNSSLTG